MAKYLFLQIKRGNLSYDVVVAKFPQFKADIDKLMAVA